MSMSRRNFMKSAGGLALAASFANWVAANPAQASSVESFFRNQRIPGHQEMNLKVGFIMTQMAAQSDQGVVQGWNDWLARKGYDKAWDAPLQDGEGSPAKVAAMMEDAVAKKVDAIVMGFVEMESIEGALKAVADAGIPLFTVDSGGLISGLAATPGSILLSSSVISDSTGTNWMPCSRCHCSGNALKYRSARRRPPQ